MDTNPEKRLENKVSLSRFGEEWQTFLLAVSFLTRIPVPIAPDAFGRFQHAFVRYFPLVGVCQALILWSVFYLLQSAGIDQTINLLLIMIVSFRLTGAFHEDGLADVADGLGGAFDCDRKIEIMKDSRLGTYGAVALWSVLTLKFVLLNQLVHLPNQTDFQFLLWLMIALSFSRITSLWVSWQIPYIGDAEKSKGTPKIHSLERANIIVILVSAILLLLFIPSPWLFLISQMLISFFASKYFRKQLGGYNGDCLGATQQISEIACYLYFVLMVSSTSSVGGIL